GGGPHPRHRCPRAQRPHLGLHRRRGGTWHRSTPPPLSLVRRVMSAGGRKRVRNRSWGVFSSERFGTKSSTVIGTVPGPTTHPGRRARFEPRESTQSAVQATACRVPNSSVATPISGRPRSTAYQRRKTRGIGAEHPWVTLGRQGRW